MKYKLLFLCIPLLCLAACSSNDEFEAVEKTPQRPIKVKVSEIPMTDTLANKSRVRKAPITDKSSIKEFYMNYYFEKTEEFSEWCLFTENISNPGDWVWKEGNVANWPQDADSDDQVAFYAYSGVDLGQYEEGMGPCFLENGQVKLDFFTDENPEETKDLLVAKDVKSYDQDGTLFFTFTHACAAMQFTICKTASLESLEVKVQKIVIHNLVSNANYVFDDPNPWVLSDIYSDYTIQAYVSGAGSITVGTEETPLPVLGSNAPADYIFAIPQAITSWSPTGMGDERDHLSHSDNRHKTYMEIICSITKGDKQYVPDTTNGFGSVYIPFTVGELKQGFVHHVKIIMGTGLKKNDGISIFK